MLAGAFATASAADSPLAGAWQLDSEQAAQAGLYLFTPTHYSMVLATTGRQDIADTSKATADELRAIWGPLRFPGPAGISIIVRLGLTTGTAAV